jgi:CBS domain containing-hemolysin-like protein
LLFLLRFFAGEKTNKKQALPIFLDRITSPAIAIILSVTAVLFFGEIVPQAICTRYGLAIGANMAWFVKGLMALMFIVCYPISLILDKALGEDHQPFYRRAELKELISMHTAAAREGGVGDEDDGHPPPTGLTHDESTIIRGALDMKAKTVKDCMTPLHAVFMLDKEDVMDREVRRFDSYRSNLFFSFLFFFFFFLLTFLFVFFFFFFFFWKMGKTRGKKTDNDQDPQERPLARPRL